MSFNFYEVSYYNSEYDKQGCSMYVRNMEDALAFRDIERKRTQLNVNTFPKHDVQLKQLAHVMRVWSGILGRWIAVYGLKDDWEGYL